MKISIDWTKLWHVLAFTVGGALITYFGMSHAGDPWSDTAKGAGMVAVAALYHLFLDARKPGDPNPLDGVIKIGLALLLSCCLVLTGCTAQQWAAVVPVLDIVTTILTDIADAEQKTNLAEHLFADYLAQHPDPVLAAQGADAIAKIRSGLQVAIDVAHGAKAAGTGLDPVSAFGQFATAWADAEKLFGPLGFMQLDRAGLASRVGIVVVDRPYALELVKGTP